MTTTPAERTAAKPGALLHAPLLYDLQVWLFTHGRERAFRSAILDRARPQPGESVLDIGCGTGSLAIAARKRVGTAGEVHGIDASPEMIARARRKAQRAGDGIVFTQATAQALPYPDGRFDVALCTIMLHHLSRPARRHCAAEMRRVLKPGGRALVVDFAASDRPRKGLLNHFHRGHGHVKLEEIVAVLDGAGLQFVESGALGVRDTQFVLATAPR